MKISKKDLIDEVLIWKVLMAKTATQFVEKLPTKKF